MIPYFPSIYGIFLIACTIGYFAYCYPILKEIFDEERKIKGTLFKNPTLPELKEMIKNKEWEKIWKGFNNSKHRSNPSWEGNT